MTWHAEDVRTEPDISIAVEREKPLSLKTRWITSKRVTSVVPGLRGRPACGADAGGSAKGAALSVPRLEEPADPDTTLAAATWERSGSFAVDLTSTLG